MQSVRTQFGSLKKPDQSPATAESPLHHPSPHRANVGAIQLCNVEEAAKRCLASPWVSRLTQSLSVLHELYIKTEEGNKEKYDGISDRGSPERNRRQFIKGRYRLSSSK